MRLFFFFKKKSLSSYKMIKKFPSAVPPRSASHFVRAVSFRCVLTALVAVLFLLFSVPFPRSLTWLLFTFDNKPICYLCQMLDLLHSSSPDVCGHCSCVAFHLPWRRNLFSAFCLSICPNPPQLYLSALPFKDLDETTWVRQQKSAR